MTLNLGNHLRRTWLRDSRLNGVCSGPSSRTGTTIASALSAIRPTPSYTFIRLPVTVMRPSGKITSASPSFTRLISVRIAIGLLGSSAIARVKRRNGFTHHCWEMPTSIANTGSLPSSDIASGGSRKLT